MAIRSSHPEDRFFVIAPASLYPRPEARLIAADGETIHTWSCDEEQPPADEDPPNFLRGWNHVELDGEGNIFAVVPLQAVLKLDSRSNLAWKCLVAAHHDIAIASDGRLYVLCEEPAFVAVDGDRYLILDHLITTLDGEGSVLERISLYQVLAGDPGVRCLIDDELRRRHASFRRNGCPADGVLYAVAVAEADAVPAPGVRGTAGRRTLRRLRELPGSPCDVLHPNTLELLDAHPRGLWEEGHALLSLRSLDLVVVVDLAAGRVVWHWGRDELSGPHQPSAVPNGNVLIFDNGVRAGRSRLVEVDPATGDIGWEYTGTPPGSFFCEVAGGCEVLPNGNVLVTDAQSARVFELTRDRRIVWEHVVADVPAATNPHRTTLYRAAAVNGSVVAKLLG